MRLQRKKSGSSRTPSRNKCSCNRRDVLIWRISKPRRTRSKVSSKSKSKSWRTKMLKTQPKARRINWKRQLMNKAVMKKRRSQKKLNQKKRLKSHNPKQRNKNQKQNLSLKNQNRSQSLRLNRRVNQPRSIRKRSSNQL